MKFLMTILLSCLIIFSFGEFTVSAFYFDLVDEIHSVDIGTLKAKIVDFQISIDHKTISADNDSEIINSGQLMLNSSALISFSIINAGSSDFNYNLDIGIAWESDLSEKEKFYIYSSELTDEVILADITYNNAFLAIAQLDSPSEIDISSGVVQGVKESLDYGTLTDNSKSYEFKLFFYQDRQITDDRLTFHNKAFELTIQATANGIEDSSKWESIVNKTAKFICFTDDRYPIININSQANSFFIEKKNLINLPSFVNAYDKKDGDLNGSMIITTPVEYDLGMTGKHRITYTVTNSLGNATSVEVYIVIWDFIKIASGNYHTLALTSHGRVYVWGYNSRGQLGDGTTSNSAVPKLVESIKNIEIIDIAAGAASSYVLAKNGQIYSWGRNDNGRLGDNTTTERRTPVKVVQPEGMRFIQISSTFNNAAALNDKGEVFTWGYSGYGASGNGSAQEDRVPTKIQLENIVQVEIGYYNGAAIDEDGILYTWGDNYRGQLGIGQRMAISYNLPGIVPYFVDNQIKIKDVNVGWYHMAAVTDDGTLYTWGYGYQGRLGNNKTTDMNTPQKINTSNKVTKCFAAYYHTAILTETQDVWFFGQNAYGKFGTGNTTNYLVPTLLNSYRNVTAIALALDTSFILVDNKTVYGMGYGGTGVLGTGANNNSTSPVEWFFSPPDQEFLHLAYKLY